MVERVGRPHTTDGHPGLQRPAARAVGPAPPRHREAVVPCLTTSPMLDRPAGRSAARRRRPGRHRQVLADRPALPRARRRAEPRRDHQRHLHRRGRPVPALGRGARPRSGSGPSRPAPARTPRSATTSPQNLLAVEDLERDFAPLDLVLVESGGDNLTATFSPALVDAQFFVLDVAGGGDVARKGGPGHRPAPTCWSSTRPTSRPYVGVDVAADGGATPSRPATADR